MSTNLITKEWYDSQICKVYPIADIDTLTDTGFYHIESSVAEENGPGAKYPCWLQVTNEVMYAGSLNVCKQTLYDTSTGVFKYRTKLNSLTWGNWEVVSSNRFISNSSDIDNAVEPGIYTVMSNQVISPDNYSSLYIPSILIITKLPNSTTGKYTIFQGFYDYSTTIKTRKKEETATTWEEWRNIGINSKNLMLNKDNIGMKIETDSTAALDDYPLKLEFDTTSYPYGHLNIKGKLRITDNSAITSSGSGCRLATQNAVAATYFAIKNNLKDNYYTAETINTRFNSYYTKSETYTRSEVNDKLSSLNSSLGNSLGNNLSSLDSKFTNITNTINSRLTAAAEDKISALYVLRLDDEDNFVNLIGSDGPISPPYNAISNIYISPVKNMLKVTRNNKTINVEKIYTGSSGYIVLASDTDYDTLSKTYLKISFPDASSNVTVETKTA